MWILDVAAEHSFVRKIALLLSSFAVVCSLAAQRNLTLYQLNAVPQSAWLNPGRMLLSNVYVGLPIIGSLNANYSNSSFTFGDLGLTGDSESDFFDNDFSDFLDLLDKDNRLLTDVNIGWIDFGFRVKKNFFSFQVTENLEFQADYPKALFELFNDIQNNIEVGAENSRTYVLDQLGFSGTHFRAYSLGYTRIITPQLSAGARLKYLSGLANVSTQNAGLRFVNDFDSEYFNIQGRMDVFSSGLKTLSDDSGAYFSSNGNHGFAFDLGADYQVNDQIEVFASLINVGSIHWKNDLTHNSFIANNVQLSTDSLDQFDEEISNFLDSLQMPSSFPLGVYKTKLPAMAYFGGNYFFRPNTSVGFIVNPRFYNHTSDWAFSLALQHRLNRWLQAVINYSNYNKTGSNIGAGLALNGGPLQLYIATDNVLPIFNISNARNAQFNAGINLTFGRTTRALQHDFVGGEMDDLVFVDSITNAEIEAEKPTAPTESLTTPAEKPAKSKKTKEIKEESTPPVTPAVAEALKPYLTLSGSAKVANSEASLEGIAVDVYRELPDGKEETVLFKSFLNGQISLSLQRTQTYKVIVKKPGYTPQEIRITPAEMQDKNELNKQFTLSIAPPPAPTEKTTPANVNAPTTAATKPAEEKVIEKPIATTTPSTRTTDTYIVTEATSLREGASHETRVLLRFPVGAKVQVVDKTAALWWRVRYLGRVGYVKAALLKPVE